MTTANLIEKIQSKLTRDLLTPPHTSSLHRLAGHCYVASEALYHLLGGSESGYKPMNVKVCGISHWYLARRDDESIRLDITAAQFIDFGWEIPYNEGRGKGFLTKAPSKRAARLMERVNG